MSLINRRQLLKAGAAAAAVAHMPGISWSQNVGTAAPFDDYRALVCVFLFGGNDSYNMLIPRSDAEYNAYSRSRQNLAVPQQDILPVSPLTPDGAAYGLHPSMAGVQRLFENGQAAFLSNVGPLVEPTTKEQYEQGSAALPPQLFSHNDQQDQWHSLKGASSRATGWAGRVADLIRSSVADQQMPTNASLFGNSLFQSAEETVAYVMGPTGPIPFQGFADSGILLEQRLAFERILAARYDTVYERGFAQVQQRAVAAADRDQNTPAEGRN